MNLSLPVVCAPRRLCAPSFVRPVVCAPRRLCAPSFLHPALAVLSLTVNALFPCAVHAGTYVWKTTNADGSTAAQSPTYTGGTVSNPPCDPRELGPFIIYNGTYTGYASGGCAADAQGNATSMTLTASGPLTAKFTWQPDYPSEPPPASVIIYQDSGAGLTNSRNAYFDTSCTCTDGFGDNATFPTSSNVGVEGYHYVGGTPGSDGSVSAPGVSPMASCTVSSGMGYGYYAAAAATAGYMATATPVTITLLGTTKDSNNQDNILVGQSCTAFLSGIPSSCTVSNYQWVITGTTFQTWQSQTPAIGNDPANLDASYYVPGPGSLAQSRPRWYWNDRLSANDGVPAPETVSCTATVTPPTGQGSAFTVTATKPVSVFKPIWTGTGIGGYSKVSVPSSQTSFFLWAGPTASQAANGLRGGMNFAATIASPDPTLFGTGSLELVQLVIPDRSVSTENGDYTYSENGQEGLDTQYPYGWYVGAPNYQEYDDPGMPLQDYVVSLAKMSDQFQTYLLYFPPSSTQCVPLATFTWSTNGTAVLPNSTGTWSNYVIQNGSDTAGTVTPSGNTATFLPSNVFPEWTQINGTGTFGLTAPVDGGTFREINLMPNNRGNTSHNTRKFAASQPSARSVQHRRSGAKHFVPMMKLHF